LIVHGLISPYYADKKMLLTLSPGTQPTKKLSIYITLIVLVFASISTTYAAEKVVLQLKWKHQFQFAGYYAALKQGYYSDAGIDVDIREVDFDRSTSEIVLSGDAQFGISDSSIVLSRMQGRPLVVVAAIFQHSPMVLITLESSGIISPLELKNKRVMYQKNIDDAVLRAMFVELNLSDDDYLHIPHTFQDEALLNGEVDAISAYITNQPFMYTKRGAGINIISPANYGIDFYGDMLFVNEKYLNENKDRVLAFREASLKGWEYALKHQEEMVDWILTNLDTVKSREHLLYEAKLTQRMIAPELIELGYFSPNRFQRIAGIYKQLDMATLDAGFDGIDYRDYYVEDSNDSQWLKISFVILISLIAAAIALWFINKRLKKQVDLRTEQYQKSEALLLEEKKKVEQTVSALQNSEALMRGLFELSPLGIALNNFETGAFVKLNDALVAPTGYTHDEFVKLSYWEITPKEYETQELEQLELLKNTGRYGPYEKEYIRKNGERYPVLLNGILVDDPLTGNKMIWSIVEDITDRKIVENELIAAKNDAEQALISKSQFLASMSHEIRTPMNGVIGMLELVLNTELNEDQKHQLKIAQFSAQSLLSLINDILDFSKVDAGKLDLEKIDFDLRGLLGEVAESMAQQAQNKGLELVLDVTGIEQSMVNSDPGRLRQILTNLIGNAIKFTHEGEVVIRASTQDFDDNQLELVCSITDTGIGIPDASMNKLFQSFTQVDATTTRKYGGTGLGLAIAMKLCELMDGRISVSSTEGVGSTFTFSVLFQKSNQSKQVLPSVDTGLLKLLIVDANASSRETLKNQLEHWGANVTTSENADQALKLCDLEFNNDISSGFDIAFLDMNLPGINGEALGRQLQSNSRFRHMKLVMMTSIAALGDARHYADIGFSAYFPKPVTTIDLFKALSVVSDDGEALRNAQPLVTRHYLQELDNENSQSAVQSNWPENTRILLVEDNHVNQLVAKGTLNTLGFQVDIAADGLQAIERLKTADIDHPYTCILMDCQMPEMDGYEATRQIRQGSAGETYIAVPIIAMTANAMKGDKEKCVAAGMDDYISKPFETDQLLDKLSQSINQVN